MRDGMKSFDLFDPGVSAIVAAAQEQRAQYIKERVAGSHAPGSRATTSDRLPMRLPFVLTFVGAVILLFYASILDTELPRSIDPAITLAIFVAATLSSIAGFAFSAICGALLVHLMSGPVRIVELMVISSIAIQAVSVWALRSAIQWRTVRPFLAGGIVSIPLGVYLLFHVRPQTFATAIGVSLICYGGFMLFRKPVTLRHSFGGMAHAFSGFVGGITGGFAGFPGAFVTIWCSLQGWDKGRQRGVYQPFILTMQVMTLLVIHLMSLQTHHAGVSALDFLYVPAAVAGTWCGLAFFARLSDRQFGAAINLLLIASGIGLFIV